MIYCKDFALKKLFWKYNLLNNHMSLKNYDCCQTFSPLSFWVDTYTCPILGSMVLLFWISGDVSSGHQSHSGFCLNRFCRAKCNVHSSRSTSGATHANLLMASIAASHFPTCISRGGSWLRFEWAITHTEDE